MPDLVESPDLKQLGTDALRDLLNNLTQAKGFILDQAPEFCQQLITWEVTCGIVLVLAAVFMWAVYLGAIVTAARSGDSEVVFPVCLFGGIPIMMISVAACFCAASALQAWVAPMVFLVEHLTHMLRH